MEFSERTIKVIIDEEKCEGCKTHACVDACKTYSRGILILKDGKPVPTDNLFEWAKWFETHHEERIVQQTRVGHYFISTVFLGLDHGFMNDKPVLWETMVFDESVEIRVFGRKMRGESFDMHRFTSAADAKKYHFEVVKAYREIFENEVSEEPNGKQM